MPIMLPLSIIGIWRTRFSVMMLIAVLTKSVAWQEIKLVDMVSLMMVVSADFPFKETFLA